MTNEHLKVLTVKELPKFSGGAIKDFYLIVFLFKTTRKLN